MLHLRSTSTGQYVIGAATSCPRIYCTTPATPVQYPDTAFNPAGVLGIGELGTVGSAAAIADAVFNATGRRVRDLPITLDKLL